MPAPVAPAIPAAASGVSVGVRGILATFGIGAGTGFIFGSKAGDALIIGALAYAYLRFRK